MRRSVWTMRVLLLFAAIIAPTVSRADISYTVNQLLPSGSITGTITTDGTQGTLGGFEIKDFSFGVEQTGVGTGKVTGGAGAGKVNLSGIDVDATPTSLIFNFAGTDGGVLQLIDTTNNNSVTWGIVQCPICGFISADITPASSVSDVLTGLTKAETIATVATPEPRTGILLLTGIALVFAMRKYL